MAFSGAAAGTAAYESPREAPIDGAWRTAAVLGAGRVPATAGGTRFTRRQLLLIGDFRIRYTPYDWSLNRQGGAR